MKKEFLEKIKFDQNGLIPAIVQDYKNKEILMFAFMNKESLEISIKSGYATYFSRSRNSLWKKGETSGNFQQIISIDTDCDFDVILLQIKQIGVACHTGKRSCFFNKIS
jgi:phosphoribosyl-ATP pyrophosphohydrolase/phosphoribosyl-AMP cyclohydrolase